MSRSSILVFTVSALALLSFGLGSPASLSTERATRMVVFTDDSAGALPWLQSRTGAVTRSGGVVTVLQQPAAFVARLRDEQWDRVLVAAKFERQEPEYVKALRTFAAKNPRMMIELHYWKADADFVLPKWANAVLAPTSICLWNNGSTHLTYFKAEWEDDESESVIQRNGFFYPDFCGIVTEAPRPISLSRKSD